MKLYGCFVQRKDAPLFTCQEESGGDASFGLVSRVSHIICIYLSLTEADVFFVIMQICTLFFQLFFAKNFLI